MKYFWLSIFLSLVLSFIVIPGCSKQSEDETVTEIQSGGIPVGTMIVATGSISRVLSTSGILEGWIDTTLMAETGGKLQSTFKSEGEHVKKGDLIAVLEHESHKYQLQAAEAGLKSVKENLRKVENGARPEELAQIKSQLASAETNYNNALENHQRMKNLFDEGVISKADLDGVESLFAGAKAAYETSLKTWELVVKGARDEDREAVKASVESAEAQRNLLKEQYDKAFFRSPFEGTVAIIYPEINEMVAPGMPVINIVNLDYLKINVSLSADEAMNIQVGQTVDILPEGFTDTISCEVTKVDIKADPISRTFSATIKIPNIDGTILPGMTASASIRYGTKDDVIVIPLDAVISRGTCKFVIVAKDNKASVGQVFSGIIDGNSVEIVSGLEVGQQIIIEGHKELTDGDLVSIGVTN